MRPPGAAEFVPDPDECEVIAGAPRFFKRRWDRADMRVHGIDKDGRIVHDSGPLGHGVIPIYGFHALSPYAEDQPHERYAFDVRGYVHGWYFSVDCPDGEYGSTALGQLEPITREEFFAAAEREWTE